MLNLDKIKFKSSLKTNDYEVQICEYRGIESSFNQLPNNLIFKLPSFCEGASHLHFRYYFMECNPMEFPSVSITIVQNPYSPMDILGCKTLPPAFSTRLSSKEQSSQAK